MTKSQRFLLYCMDDGVMGGNPLASKYYGCTGSAVRICTKKERWCVMSNLLMIEPVADGSNLTKANTNLRLKFPFILLTQGQKLSYV